MHLQVDEKAASHKDKPSTAAPEPTAPGTSATPSTAAPPAGIATPRTTGGHSRAGSTPKAKDAPKTASKGASKGSKKTVPASFVEVIDCLVDVTLRYKGMQPGEEADLADPVPEAMETDQVFSISAQLPDGRMVDIHHHPVRQAGAAAAGQAASGAAGSGPGAQGKPAAKASFTEQVKAQSHCIAASIYVIQPSTTIIFLLGAFDVSEA